MHLFLYFYLNFDTILLCLERNQPRNQHLNLTIVQTNYL
nr:MAG TPA: hypothetical protein [Crassvirales sp.]